MGVSNDEPSKVMMVGIELAKEIQEIKRALRPKPDMDMDKDKDKKGKGRLMKKGDAVAEVAAGEETPNTDAPSGAPAAKAPRQGGRWMVLRSTPPHPLGESSMPPDVYPAECREQDWRWKSVAMAGPERMPEE